MNIEINLIISILKLTVEGPVSEEIVKKDAKMPSQIAEKLLRKMQNQQLIYLKKNVVEASRLQRLKLAIRAVELGGDVESVSSFLQWQEFEDIAVIAFERNNYSVNKNFRFKHGERKFEIDVIGCKKPIIVCVDCKHWHRSMCSSVIKKIVKVQNERTLALAESLPNLAADLKLSLWKTVKLLPAVLSLAIGGLKYCDNVPIVPILQLQDFLGQLPAHVNNLKHFTRTLPNQLTLRHEFR